MSNNGKNLPLTDVDTWLRLAYMLVFGLLSGLARLLLLVVAAIQFVLVLITGESNSNLRSFGYGLAKWTEQAFLFLSFASERKPYPFQDWPMPAIEEPEVDTQAHQGSERPEPAQGTDEAGSR